MPCVRIWMEAPMTASTREEAEAMHKMAMDAIAVAANLLTVHADTFKAFLEAERSMHSHLHITNPTLYRQAIHSKSFDQQRRLITAASAFLLAVQEVRNEVLQASAQRPNG